MPPEPPWPWWLWEGLVYLIDGPADLDDARNLRDAMRVMRRPKPSTVKKTRRKRRQHSPTDGFSGLLELFPPPPPRRPKPRIISY